MGNAEIKHVTFLNFILKYKFVHVCVECILSADAVVHRVHCHATPIDGVHHTELICRKTLKWKSDEDAFHLQHCSDLRKISSLHDVCF